MDQLKQVARSKLICIPRILAGIVFAATLAIAPLTVIAAPGDISTIAGNGAREFGTGEGIDPFGMAVDSAGNVYIADLYNHRIRKVDPNGVMTTVAGNGVEGFSGDGGPATSASLTYPHDVAVDAAGNLYIADLANNRIRKVDPSGIISTVAGNGVGEFSGDGGPATSASLWGPKGVAVDSGGNLYIADFDNGLVRKVDSSGIITTVAGGGTDKVSGGGQPATTVEFSWLTDVEVDGAGNLYLADESDDRVYKVDGNGTITVAAGNGLEGFSGDGGPATDAPLVASKRIALDSAGNLYISDSGNGRIRKVDGSGIITTVVGNGSTEYSGDGGPAVDAGLPYPNGVTIDKAGNLYIGDGSYHIRKVASSRTDTPATATPETATPMPTATPTVDPTALRFEPPTLSFVWTQGARNPVSQQVLAHNAKGQTGWHPGQFLNTSGTSWVAGGLEMNISVSPANAKLDVGVHETQLLLESNGMTATLPVNVTVVSANGTLQVNRKKLNFGGFLGEPIADQRVEVTFTGLNSTDWTATGPSWLTLTPAKGSVAATAPTSLSVGIDAAAISAVGKYTGTLTVRDGKTTHEIAVELSQVAPGSPTIQLFGLEVTQGVQNLLNDVPFVAERPVFVRGHVRSLTGDPIEKVTAQLIGTRDGATLGTLNPSNPGGSIKIVADPNREKSNESFLFELPESWRTGTVTLRLVGQSQPIACVDPAEKSAVDAVAEDCTVTLTYETIPVLPITYFLYTEQGKINYFDGRRSTTANFSANASHASATSSQLFAGLPIPRVDQQISATTLTFPGARSSADQPKVLDIIKAEYEKAGKPLRHFYGLFARYESKPDPKASIQGGPGGVAGVPGFYGFGEYYTFQPMATLNMHEIGHNLGRNHVGCGNPANPDAAYPYPEQRISQVVTGDEAYYGFNIVTQEIYPPTYKDYMSYCDPSWISPYTYKAMMERLKIHYKSDQTTPTGTSGSRPSPILLISGRITDTTTGGINGVVDDNGFVAIPPENSSDYNVRLEDANGQMIATYPAIPQSAEGQNQKEFTTYTLAVPRPETLARVVLLYDAQPLDERIASANAPTITLTTPAGGELIDNQSLTITWRASDADGDALTFNVDYSTDDGATWQKLAWDWSESALAVASADLPGSTQARIRVSANDGFLTTFAASEPFTVTDHAPVAIILTTELNHYYVGGQSILLEGTGYDAEDGMLSDLTWYSDRDGLLGTGPNLLLNADDLAEGTHLIRLEAKDSSGQSSFGDPTAGVTSEESALATNDTVRFDILYDPLTLPAELAVAPDLLFSTISGSTELLTNTLTVSNLGDGELGWVASSDSATITLSSNSGDAPATVVVTVDPTGLDIGLHQGILTFTSTGTTSTGANVDPVTVDYFINIESDTASANAQNNTYAVESNVGGDESPWLDEGMWVIGGRQGQQVVALDIASSDGGETLTGTVTYAGEGPIAFRATKSAQNTYRVEVQWGDRDAPWNPNGTWVLGSRENVSLVALNVSATDEGSTLEGTMAYADGSFYGFRATLQSAAALAAATASMADESVAPEPQVEETDPLPESTAAAESPTAAADRFPVLPGQMIVREQQIPSESGNHYLIFQTDGNVVVYTADDQYVWGLQSITDEYQQAQSVQMEADGNFVVRGADDEFIWSALRENPDSSAYLTLTAEGVLQLVSGDSGAVLWASDGTTALP